MSKMFAGIMAAGAIACATAQALAADPGDQEWPCVQRKVAALTAAQMWDGGDVEGLTQWRDDDGIRRLLPPLASRRVPLDDAAAAIVRFAEAQPQDKRDDALRQLFAGLLSTVNADRAVVMSGIERFYDRQRARAAEIERQGAAIRQLKELAASDERARAELVAAEERYNWDVRVFTERQQSLPLACEVPVLIEQRLFALGREIRARMNE
jgi:hypothetical protein